MPDPPTLAMAIVLTSRDSANEVFKGWIVKPETVQAGTLPEFSSLCLDISSTVHHRD